MILVADSGSTKTDWGLADRGKLVERIATKGINPFFQSDEDIQMEITERLLPRLAGYRPDAVYFYGAGCAFPEVNERVRVVLTDSLGVPAVVESDLFGAARALCGRQAGIACILGTGSNSCFYDGRVIADRIPPLGFILGDEGSGAALGKQLIGDCLKKQLPEVVREAFHSEYPFTQAEILDRIYKQPFPNRFLAGLSPFLASRLEVPEIRRLVRDAFCLFFMRNVRHYDYRRYPVHAVGSIAYYYRSVLQEAAAETEVTLGRILQSPLEGLAAYHTAGCSEIDR